MLRPFTATTIRWITARWREDVQSMTSPHGTPPNGPPEPARPTPGQIAATLAVLGDDDGPVLQAARARLLAWVPSWGETVLGPLQAAAQAEPVLLRLRARGVLRELEVRDHLRRFAALRLGVPGRAFAPALLEGAVLLSQMVRTFAPGTVELAGRLRAIALSLRKEFAGRSLPVCARRLAERLHGEVGLRGEQGLPGDVGLGCGPGQPGAGPVAAVPGGSTSLDGVPMDRVLIDRVLATRCGIPVSLSLIYLLVARWAGLSAAGVWLPGHFLVRLHGVRPVLLDPYHGGRSVTKADCARYLRAHGHDHVREHLRDRSDREVLIHSLRCLQRAASHRAVPQTQQTLGRALACLETS